MTDTTAPEVREFHLGDLLSVTGGYLVSPRHVDGIYDLVGFVTGEKHMSHQLLRAADTVKPWLLEQHPWLADVAVPDGLKSEDAVTTWLVTATRQYGENHPVQAMPFGMYVGREPMAEARELMPNATVVIPIEIPPNDDRDGGAR